MEEGLDPTLGAILPLVGVMIGGLLNVVITAVAERRRRAREAKVVARLVAEDLMHFVAACNGVLGMRSWLPLRLEEDPLAGWREHRVTLADALERQEWRLLRITVRRMKVVASAANRQSPGGLDVEATDDPFIQGAHDYAARTYIMLDKIADIGLHSRRRRRVTARDVGAGLMTDDPFSASRDEADPAPNYEQPPG